MKLNQKTTRVKTPFGDLPLDVDNLFDQVFGDRLATRASQGWQPRVSILESDSAYQLSLELPGADPGSVSVELHENRLEIVGDKVTEELPEGFRLIRDERLVGKFHRSFEFAQPIDADRIEATFQSGVLQVQLPKSNSVLPRKIEIKIPE